MNVLIDIEWVQSGEDFEITQIAAVRVSEKWETVDTFGALVCPASCWNVNWDHMAYNGYSPDEFRAGSDEASCLLRLLHFLKADDTLICWHKDTEHVLKRKWETTVGEELLLKCRHVNQKVHGLASARGIDQHGLYETAAAFGIELPAPKHQATNDVQVMQRLLSKLNIQFSANSGAIQDAPRKKTRREKILEALSHSQYNYIFTLDSNVFHRVTCHLMLNAKTIHGTVRYEKASRGRVPCKVCRPQPGEPRESPPAQQKKYPEPLKKELIKTRLLGDHVVKVASTKIVGHCYNMTHPGDLTLKIMEEHDCLKKNCPFFKKYEDRPYWIDRNVKEKRKAERKQARQAERFEARKQAEKLAALKESLQSYADEAGPPLYIVRLETEAPHRYKVFYVSENSFKDGDRFKEFLGIVRRNHPDISLHLRHIRHVDGHFVTIAEFFARKR